MPLNLEVAKILKQTDSTLDQKTQLAVAQLMLWALYNDVLEQEPAWATVRNYSDRYQSRRN